VILELVKLGVEYVVAKAESEAVFPCAEIIENSTYQTKSLSLDVRMSRLLWRGSRKLQNVGRTPEGRVSQKPPKDARLSEQRASSSSWSPQTVNAAIGWSGSFAIGLGKADLGMTIT
jgi:hypothetical protein